MLIMVREAITTNSQISLYLLEGHLFKILLNFKPTSSDGHVIDSSPTNNFTFIYEVLKY